MLRANAIIAQFNTQPRRNFPVLDGAYEFSAGMRLTAFSDGVHWAMTIENLVFVTTAGPDYHFQLIPYVFGNAILGPPGWGSSDLKYPLTDGDDGPVLAPQTSYDVNPGVKSVRIRGKLVRFELTLHELRKRGIQPQFPGQLIGPDIYRMLAADYRDLLFSPEAELTERFRKKLPQLLHLHEWHHPDVLSGEFPGATLCFQSIAEVLANADASLYEGTEPPNTHWSNWPRAGML